MLPTPSSILEGNAGVRGSEKGLWMQKETDRSRHRKWREQLRIWAWRKERDWRGGRRFKTPQLGGALPGERAVWRG